MSGINTLMVYLSIYPFLLCHFQLQLGPPTMRRTGDKRVTRLVILESAMGAQGFQLASSFS